MPLTKIRGIFTPSSVGGIRTLPLNLAPRRPFRNPFGEVKDHRLNLRQQMRIGV
jgi:hypothetical protein